MPRSSRWAGLILATCAVGVVGATSTTCGDRARVYVFLERSAVETSASGSIQLQMNGQRSTLRLRVKGLLADTEYLLLADGVQLGRRLPGGQAADHLNLVEPGRCAHGAVSFAGGHNV